MPNFFEQIREIESNKPSLLRDRPKPRRQRRIEERNKAKALQGKNFSQKKAA